MNRIKSGKLFARLAGIIFVLSSLEGFYQGGRYLIYILKYSDDFDLSSLVLFFGILIGPFVFFMLGILLLADKTGIPLVVFIGIRAAIDCYLLFDMISYVNFHSWLSVAASLALFASILFVTLPPKRERLLLAKIMCFLPFVIYILNSGLGTLIEVFSKVGFEYLPYFLKEMCINVGVLFLGLWVWKKSTLIRENLDDKSARKMF